MVMINVVDGEYGATANTLQQVSGELQGAKIDDLSEAVESSMKGADSIAKATGPLHIPSCLTFDSS